MIFVDYMKKASIFSAVFFSSFAHASTPVGLVAGGQSNTGIVPYLAIVNSDNTVTPITLPTNISIESIAINSSGQGLVGGANDSSGEEIYAAMVSLSSATATTIVSGTSGVVNGVAINSSGQGILGGSTFSGAMDFPY